LEDLLVVIIFIIIAAVRTMADRKQGMTRGQKAKPVTPPRARTRPAVQAEPARPRKKQPAEAKAVPPYPGEFQPVRKVAAEMPPPLMPPLEEGQSDYERTVGREVMPTTSPLEREALPPVAEAEEQAVSGLSYEELRRAILWSEILGKPRSKRKSIR